jgi:hypothetical protein
MHSLVQYHYILVCATFKKLLALDNFYLLSPTIELLALDNFYLLSPTITIFRSVTLS